MGNGPTDSNHATVSLDHERQYMHSLEGQNSQQARRALATEAYSILHGGASDQYASLVNQFGIRDGGKSPSGDPEVILKGPDGKDEKLDLSGNIYPTDSH